MTREEQIKEAADKFQREFIPKDKNNERFCFISGVLWANEHPQSSWISVKDRLPEKLENGCTSDYVLTRIDGPRQVWYFVNRYNYTIEAWEGCNNNTTHWMPIQRIEKGE